MNIGRAYRLTKDLLGFTDAGAGLVTSGINQADHSATFVISTVGEDREGDVMLPDGCKRRLDSYRRNPVVLFDHNQHLQAIGLSTSPQGVLGIKFEPGRVLATCWYHLKTRESRDCWAGVCGGWLRGASVGFVPHTFEQIDPRKGYRKGYRTGDDGGLRRKPGYLHSDWELSEWSNVVLPMNAEALRVGEPGKSLNALGKEMGRSLESRIIRKSLESAGYPVTGIWSPGVTINKGSAVANLRTRYSTKAHKSREKVVKAFARQGVDPAQWLLHKTTKAWVFVQKSAEDEEIDDVAKKGGGDGLEQPKEEKPEAVNATETKEEEPVKLGAQALADVHRHHSGLAEYIDSMRPHIDNAEVMKELDEHHGAATAAAEKVKEAAGKHYPDVDFDKLSKPPEAEKELPSEEDLEDTEDDDDAELEDEDTEDDDALDDIDEDEEDDAPAKRAKVVTKAVKPKRLRINKSGQMCVKEAADFMDEVGAHEQVPKSLRIAAGYHGKQLTGLLQDGEDQGQDNGMGGQQAKEEEEGQMEEKALAAAQKALKVFCA